MLAQQLLIAEMQIKITSKTQTNTTDGGMEEERLCYRQMNVAASSLPNAIWHQGRIWGLRGDNSKELKVSIV